MADETCPDCDHAQRLHYALGHVGCHNLTCDCKRVPVADETNAGGLTDAEHWRGRFERMRLMYRERFNEGLSTADWHAKYCAAQRAAVERDAARLALAEGIEALHVERPGSMARIAACIECGHEWPCQTVTLLSPADT